MNGVGLGVKRTPHSQISMQEIFLPFIKEDGSLFEKFQKIWARIAVVGERVVTITSDGKETENTAKEGDFVVEAQTQAKERYIIGGDKLTKRYNRSSTYRCDPEGTWYEHIPTGTVKAVEWHPNVFRGVFGGVVENLLHFIAPWGEEAVCKKGDMICTTDGVEVYRIARKEFEQTYRIV